MKKIYFVLIFVVIVLFGGTFSYHFYTKHINNQFFSKLPTPVVSISTAIAKKQNWQQSLPAIGTVIANNGVDVNARVSGMVSKILFHSGDQVKKGQQLVQLDDSLDQKTLENDEIQLTLDQLTYNRKKKLFQTNSISREEYETVEATLKKQRNKVITDRLMISYKKIRAPFSGKLGIRKVNLGQYLQPGSTIVTLQDLNTVLVYFSLSQQNLSKVAKGQAVLLKKSAYPKTVFHGKISSISPKLKTKTRTVEVRARFTNKDNMLTAGQFVDLNITLTPLKNVVTVPLTAVTFTLYGDTIYIVKPTTVDGKKTLIAHSEKVKVGPTKGDLALIERGISSGDQVVISGQLKLHNGSHVSVLNLKNK